MGKIPSQIILYGEGVGEQLLYSLSAYLQTRLSLPVHISMLEYPEDSASLLASLRIRSPRGDKREPLPLEIELEKKGLKENSPPKGVIYDGWGVMKLILSFIPSPSTSRLQLVITSRLLSTGEGGIHHIRSILLGYPCIISTSGLVEGPAKPREFYITRRLFADGLVGYQILKEKQYLQQNDYRLPLVVRGYTLQAFFYHAFSDPFCPDMGCSLYNAHTQEELIYAQIESPYELCPRHQEILQRWKTS